MVNSPSSGLAVGLGHFRSAAFAFDVRLAELIETIDGKHDCDGLLRREPVTR